MDVAQIITAIAVLVTAIGSTYVAVRAANRGLEAKVHEVAANIKEAAVVQEEIRRDVNSNLVNATKKITSLESIIDRLVGSPNGKAIADATAPKPTKE